MSESRKSISAMAFDAATQSIVEQAEHARQLQVEIEQLQAEVERLKLSKLDQENLRMGQMIQKAAETLPEDFEITVRIVLEAGGVELTNPDADTVYIDNDPDGLSHSIEQAINLAKEQAND